MRYFQNPNDNNKVYGYDSATQTELINTAVASGWVEVTGNWPPSPTLAQAQAAQSAILAAACQSAIEAGFTSSALGSANTYGCKATDQTNVGLAAASGGSLWCENSAGAWAFTAHTTAQAQQVQKDMAAHIQAEQTHYAQQLAAVAAATTVSGVQAVVW